MALRSEYTSRFDPFVLTVEHEATNRGKLSAPPDGSRAKFVRFKHLDNDLAPKDATVKAAQEAETERLMKKLGFADLGLIREFDLCRFTHGYTRVSATPILEKRGQNVPVRRKSPRIPVIAADRPCEAISQDDRTEECFEDLRQQHSAAALSAVRPAGVRSVWLTSCRAAGAHRSGCSSSRHR